MASVQISNECRLYACGDIVKRAHAYYYYYHNFKDT